MPIISSSVVIIAGVGCAVTDAVWEKMAEKMQSLGRGATGVKKVVSTWAKQQGLLHNKNQVYGASGASPMLFPVADRVVLSKVALFLSA